MCRALFSVLVSAIGITLVGSAWAQEPPQPPKGYVIIDESALFTLINESEKHFLRSVVAYQQNDPAEAAREIRAGATIMKMEASRATAEGRADVLDSVIHLQILASELEEGKKVSLQTMHIHFAHAEYAAAEHHFLRAREDARLDRSDVAVSYHLYSAGLYLHQSIRWADREADRALDAAMESNCVLSRRFSTQSPCPGQAVEDAFAVIASGLERNASIGSPAAP